MDDVLETVAKTIGTAAAKVTNALSGSEEKQNGGASSGRIRIQYYRSAIGFPKNQKQIVRSVGLTKLNQIVERPDNASTRGVVAKVPHLLRIVD